MKKSFITLAILTSISAGATNQPQSPSLITQHQDQSQGQAQYDTNNQSSNVTASPNAFSSSSPNVVTSASNSNSGNNASQSINTYNQRSAPGSSQGSLMISGCAVAGNGGGSGVNGSAFLGFAFTPQQCYDFMLAQAYSAIGANRAACEVLNVSKAGRRASHRGVSLPTCSDSVVPIPATPAVVVITEPSNVSKAELAEHEHRIVEKLSGK